MDTDGRRWLASTTQDLADEDDSLMVEAAQFGELAAAYGTILADAGTRATSRTAPLTPTPAFAGRRMAPQAIPMRLCSWVTGTWKDKQGTSKTSRRLGFFTNRPPSWAIPSRTVRRATITVPGGVATDA